MKNRLTIYLAAAAILAATAAIPQARGQDDLDSLTKAAATPAPTVAATPKPAAIQQAPAATPQPRATTTTAAPRSTPAPAAAPRESAREQLAHGHFIVSGDLASMAGKKVPAGTFLTGQWKATGQQSGGRKEFTDAGLFGGKTKLLVRFPVTPDPRVLQAGSSTKWEKAAPLRVDSVTSTKDGITAFCTDVTP